MSAQLEVLASDSNPFRKPLGNALPPAREHEDFLRDVPNALSAYHVCLELERHAMELAKTIPKAKAKSKSTNQSTNTDDPVICARILGYLLLYSPSQHALGEVVKAIHSCSIGDSRYSKLLELGACFQNWFIRSFRKFKGRTPQLSDHSSRPSFNDDRKIILENLKEAPRSHVDAKKAALYRDGYRCVVSGIYDISAPEFGVSFKDILKAGYPVNTECAHIVPESTYLNVKGAGSELKAGYAESVLAVLKRFGYSVENLNGAKVHSLYNVMTMQKDMHDRFDRLELWFEPAKTTNQYKPTAFSPLLPLPEVVTLTSRDLGRFPVPSPELLALHAACCKVALMSGAAEYLDKYDSDMDLDVLDPDGTSSGVLHHAIWEKLGRSVDIGM